MPALHHVLGFCAALALGALPASAAVYKSVDKNGRVTFSDVPQGEKVDELALPQINAQKAVTPKPYTPSKRSAPSTSYSVRLASPANGSQIVSAAQQFPVSANIAPELSEGYKAQLLLNGRRVGSGNTSGSFTAHVTTPGKQQVSVAVISPSGSIVARSTTATVYVIRPRAN